jgi:hypothetical protein
VRNIYFELTREFNARDPIAALASGQAVVYYRIAIMSKDGDWVLKETPEACNRVLSILAKRKARYRAGAPLDTRWLGGGWSSHFEFPDERGRRVRCDFFSRPPRISRNVIESLFSEPPPDPILVVDVESLIRMKQTQRAKDYPTIAELAKLLPPEGELELTTDPDRILELTPEFGAASKRVPVRAAHVGKNRQEIVVALAQELDELQQLDKNRLERYQRASKSYLEAFHFAGLSKLPLNQAHQKCLELASALLPQEIGVWEEENAESQ